MKLTLCVALFLFSCSPLHPVLTYNPNKKGCIVKTKVGFKETYTLYEGCDCNNLKTKKQ